MLLFAHGIVGRADLPIPEALFGAAAAAVLVVSFLALAAGWSTPRLEPCRERPLFRIPLAVEVLLGAIGVAVFAIIVYAGLAGTDSQQDNLAPTAVYVGFWVGVPFVSLLFGDCSGCSARGARSAGRPAGPPARLSRGEPTEAFPYPERLGHWPAVAGILAFVICELCWATGREPTPLAVLMLIYVFVQLAGHGRLRRRAVVAPRRRVRRLVRAVRDARAVRGAARTGASCCARRSPARRGSRPSRARSRCW